MVITDKYVDSYIDFISNCKTERECIEYARKKLSEHGFRDYSSGVPNAAYETNAPNGKVVISKMGKTLAAFKFGRKPIEEGLNIPAGTKFEELPASFKCPKCRMAKAMFEKID